VNQAHDPSAPKRSARERRASTPDDHSELERFKRDIDLRTFAISKGYQLDEGASTHRWTVLRHDVDNDKIVVYVHGNGHWRYYSHRPENHESHGTIIDFVRWLDGKNLGEIRKELRDWTNSPPPRPPELDRSDARPVPDRAAVVRQLEKAAAPGGHSYLEEERGLLRETLSHPRFHGTWRQAPGRHRAVLFLHRDEIGICGAEVKNAGYTGFYRGGTKGLWMSKAQPTDCRLVITESGIDALSYHQLNAHPKARYISFAGEQTTKQPALIESAISWMPAGSVIVAATDNDEAGHAFAKNIAELCSKHPHVTFERHAPQRFRFPDGRIGKDWNDHLQALRCPTRACIIESSQRPGLDR
jgi:hypothetical protein